MKIAVAITGASGSVIGLELIKELKKKKIEVITLVSKNGEKVIQEETGIKLKSDYEEDDFFSPIASSSQKIDAFIGMLESHKTK